VTYAESVGISVEMSHIRDSVADYTLMLMLMQCEMQNPLSAVPMFMITGRMTYVGKNCAT